MIKQSVNEIKWSSLLAMTRALVLCISNFWYGARKVTGTFEKRAPRLRCTGVKNIFLSKIGSGFGEPGYTCQSSPGPIYSFDQPFSETLVPEALRFSPTLGKSCIETTVGLKDDDPGKRSSVTLGRVKNCIWCPFKRIDMYYAPNIRDQL